MSFFKQELGYLVGHVHFSTRVIIHSVSYQFYSASHQFWLLSSVWENNEQKNYFLWCTCRQPEPSTKKLWFIFMSTLYCNTTFGRHVPFMFHIEVVPSRILPLERKTCSCIQYMYQCPFAISCFWRSRILLFYGRL